MEARANRRGVPAVSRIGPHDRDEQALPSTSDGAVAPEQLTSRFREVRNFAVLLLGVGATYFVLAKLGLELASVNPSATPIWPPTGFALAAVLLWGYRVWPAIWAAAITTARCRARRSTFQWRKARRRVELQR